MVIAMDNGAENNPLIFAPKVSPVSIDGDLSDWDEASDWADFGAWYNGGLASTTRIQYAWSGGGSDPCMLYLGIESTEGDTLIMEVGGLTTDIDAIPSASDEATQIEFKDWAGGVAGTVTNQLSGILTDVSAAYTVDGGTITIEIATPIYADWTIGHVNAGVALAAQMDVWTYVNVADAGWTAADSQVADGTYMRLYNSAVGLNASLIRLLDGPHPTGAGDLPAGAEFADPDYDSSGLVDFADFAVFSADYGKDSYQ